MTELRTRVVPIQVDKACTRCTVGRMRPTGITRPMFPPKHDHACNKCGHEERYTVHYPHIDYEPENAS